MFIATQIGEPNLQVERMNTRKSLSSIQPSGRYDQVTIALHWLTAGMVLALWMVGTFLEDIVPKGELRSAIWSAHFDLGFVFAGVLVALLVWRHTGGRRLRPVDIGPLHVLAKSTHAALYALLLVIIVLGIANALVRGVDLLGPVRLPRFGDYEWRRPLTHWHGLAANVLMGLSTFHAAAALVHHYLWRDSVLLRILPKGLEAADLGQRATNRDASRN